MISDRAILVSPSYTIGISTKVMELNEQGRNIVNLSVGEPDFYISDKAKDAAIQALKNNLTKYDKVPGLIELRKAICRKLKEENGVDYEPEQIVVSNGAKQAITNGLFSVINPGDEVIVPVPYWTSYPEIIKLCGAVPVLAEPEDNNRYKITVDDIKKCLTDKTKMLFFNNPSNPAGTVYSKEEVTEIAEFCLENNIWILSDEIYERFCFEGEFTSTASISPEIKNITIVINGMSKSAAMTGLRIGYTASSKEIASAISKIQGHLTSHPSTISQWAACEALLNCRDDINGQLEIYRKRREYIIKRLDAMDKVTYIKPDGAFYVMINFGAFRDKIKYDKSFSVEFCNKMLEEVDVAVVPGIAFGMDDYVRISYTVSIENLKKGFDGIEKFINSL